MKFSSIFLILTLRLSSSAAEVLDNLVIITYDKLIDFYNLDTLAKWKKPNIGDTLICKSIPSASTVISCTLNALVGKSHCRKDLSDIEFYNELTSTNEITVLLRDYEKNVPVLPCHLKNSSIFIAKISGHEDIYILIGKRSESRLPEPLAVVTHLLNMNVVNDFKYFTDFAMNKNSRIEVNAVEQLLFFRNYIQMTQLCASSYFWMLSVIKEELQMTDSDFIETEFKGSLENLVYFYTSNTSASPIQKMTYTPMLNRKCEFSVIECLFKDRKSVLYTHMIIPHAELKEYVYIKFEGYERSFDVLLFHVPNLLEHLKY